MPGTKTALVELAVVLAERESTVLLPDPGYPDYPSGLALAAAKLVPLRLDPAAGWAPAWAEAPREDVAAVYLNYPSNPAQRPRRPASSSRQFASPGKRAPQSSTTSRTAI